jgi:hypothetical protein
MPSCSPPYPAPSLQALPQQLPAAPAGTAAATAAWVAGMPARCRGVLPPLPRLLIDPSLCRTHYVLQLLGKLSYFPTFLLLLALQEFGGLWTDMLAPDQQLPWDAKAVMHIVDKGDYRCGGRDKLIFQLKGSLQGDRWGVQVGGACALTAGQGCSVLLGSLPSELGMVPGAPHRAAQRACQAACWLPAPAR